MLEKIIYYSIRHRWIILFVVLGLMALGVSNFNKLPIDAVPDITNVQVQINTQADGYSPLEVEQRITFPIETVLSGIPNLDYTRQIWTIPVHFHVMAYHKLLLCLMMVLIFILHASYCLSVYNKLKV